MLRPATPLAVVLFAAFALLLVSVLSTPVIKGVPLCSFDGVTFGVFGFCKGDDCSPIEIGYDTAGASSPDDQASFNLPSSTRNTLSAVLVIHPVACLLTLTMFIMSVAAHFHAPSHSVRYLLLVFIVSIFDFLACLLAFLIDVLLFAPHMAWGSWIVLAATIMVALAGLVSCAMRRTLVSRKSRKKRIEQNAEMSGENFYNRQAQASTTTAARQPTMPTVMSGAGAETDKLPVFASFEKQEDRSSDERVPLTSRSPSDRSPNGAPSDLMPPGDAQMMNAPPAGMRRSPSIPRDQYGNPIGGPVDAYGVRRGPSMERMNGRGRGGMPPGGYRGRGGYGPPGRGGGYGPPGRGGYGQPGRGGYGPPQGGRGGYGPPPRSYGGSQRGQGPPPGYQYERNGPYGVRGPSPSAPGYSSTNPSMPSVATGSYEAYTPERASDLPRAESPPPLPEMSAATAPGQAVEMDAATGSPGNAPQGFGQFGQIRDSDADIAGMVVLQQGMAPNAPGNDGHPRESDTNRYSEEGEYVPPRANWNNAGGRNSPRMGSPLNVPGRSAAAGTGPSTRSPPPPEAPNSNAYFEDVDPRFAAEQKPQPIQTNAGYDELPQGARSPAESERSNFTSISQRSVNPRWNPPPPSLMPGYNGQAIPRRPARNPNDHVLNSNPDFAVPRGRGANSPPARGGAGGRISGSAYPAM